MTPDRLLPGDVLLYSERGLFSAIIRVKSWSAISHVELYDGRGHAVASRPGQGVGRYPLRVKGLAVVLRSSRALDLAAARAYFATVDGQGYDWLGLLSFTAARWQHKFDGNTRQFCSEFATNFLRAGGLDPFNGYPASGIAPGEFLKSPVFTALGARDLADAA